MNERIQAIKNQCWVERHWDNDKELMIDGHVDLDKFAELVVKECSKFLKDQLDEYFAAEQLEEYFGVEE